MTVHSTKAVDDNSEEAQAGQHRDYWAIAVRRYWWLTIPLFTLGLAGVMTARLWPVVYRSEALVLVEQQKVPEQYVTPNVLSDLQYRLNSMTQQILSRTRLQRLIDQFGLYPRERARMTVDEVIDRMRRDIQVELVQAPGRQGQLTAFRINYSTDHPRTAQRVADQLTSLFIDENLRARTQQSQSTTSFLENQLDAARQALAKQEERLRTYKMQFLGELPQQEQGNLQILSSLEAQLRNSTAALDRAQQQKIYLESLRVQYQQIKEEQRRGTAAPADPLVDELASKLRQQQALLTSLRSRYTPEYPEIAVLEKQIAETAELKKRTEAEAAAATTARADKTPEVSAVVGAGATNERALIEVESRLKSLESEIAKGNEENAQLRRRIQDVHRRLSRTPVREEQLAEVTRNYENSKSYYQSLLQKKLGSELATNLELRQQGEQFRTLDPASLPQKPSSPNRLEIVALGWLVGLCAGIGLALVVEVMDTSLRSEKDLALYTQAPVLVRLPVLRSARAIELARRYKTLRIAWLVVLLAAFLGSSAQAYLAS